MEEIITISQLDNYLSIYQDEERSERPDWSFLHSYATKLLQLIKQIDLQNQDIQSRTISLRHDVDIFRADLTEIKGDYDKRNKRYKVKWLDRKSTIDSYKKQLIKILNDSKI